MTEPTLAVRRNGLLQSCEPCRKSKLKCDHGRPVCGRCTSKNIAQRCFYHPAPMTKGEPPSQNRVVKKRKNLPERSSSNSSSPQVSPSVEYTWHRATSESALHTHGYLGSTSFSAILAEHPADLSLSFDADSSTAGGATSKPADPLRLHAGLEVVKLLYHQKVYDILIKKFYSGTLLAVVASTIVDAVLRSIRRVFDRINPNKDLETQLQDLVDKIFRRSARPLTTYSSMTVEEYCAAFTDENLRWEALGIIFATAGIALMSTPDADPNLLQVAPDSQAREVLQSQILEASSICLGFCDHAASVNELLGFYQYNDVMLRTQHYGDSSYQAWRRLGDLTATIYAAGIHQENVAQTNDCPPFLRQWRRVCFASAFYVDKCLSTFVGRPPYINYRYCSLVPPLDVSEDLLIAGGDRLDQAISELDSAGWSREPNYFRVSMIRLRFLLSVFREQALEIALGTSFEWDLVPKANEVIEKARRVWEAVPDRIRYDIYVKDDTEHRVDTTFTIRHSYLDYLYSLFLIQRTIAKRTNTGQEALFNTSRLLLSIIVGINAERDPFLDLTRHYSWIVLYYGLPSASVLTLELLRQTQEVGPSSVMLPRAELIRNLSVFVSCLSWVSRPGHGNYRTCKVVEKKLSDILDQILDPQPAERDVIDVDTSGLYSLLDWYNPDNWDFKPDFLPARDGFPF